MDNIQIGNRIKNRRKELKFTLQEIADMVGVASSTIQRYESGSISQYKLPVLESIAKAINVNPTWLVKENAQMETNIPDEIFVKENKPIIKISEPMTFTIKTSDYISSKPKELSQEETILLENFNKLNCLGKKEAIKRVSELTEINKYIKNTYDEISASEDNVIQFRIAEEQAEYNFAAHDDGLSTEKAKERIEKAKAIFKQMDEE